METLVSSVEKWKNVHKSVVFCDLISDLEDFGSHSFIAIVLYAFEWIGCRLRHDCAFEVLGYPLRYFPDGGRDWLCRFENCWTAYKRQQKKLHAVFQNKTSNALTMKALQTQQVIAFAFFKQFPDSSRCLNAFPDGNLT
jgi:hypothetical protein